MSTKTILISPQEPLELQHESYIRIESLSVSASYTQLAKFIHERISIMLHVSTVSHTNREINIDASIASFIIGKDFEHECNLLLSPADECSFFTLGPPIPIQIKYSILSA